MKKKILTESERLKRNAYMRKYKAEHKGLPKPGRLQSKYPFDRHIWKRIESRLDRLIEDYSWSLVDQVIEAVRSKHQAEATKPELEEEV